MNYDWQQLSDKGKVETGLYLKYRLDNKSKDVDTDPDTIIVIHAFGNKAEGIDQIFARLYFERKGDGASDTFAKTVANDIQGLIEDYTGTALGEEFLAHIELFDIDDMNIPDPYSLGDFTFV